MDILSLCEKSSFSCEKEAIQSKHHKHDLYEIKEYGEIDCSICKGLIESEDCSYICLDCPFILCQVCRDEEEGKKNNKEYIFELIKDKEHYEKILRREKKSRNILFSTSYEIF